MAFCASCGAPVEGRFCAKCGAPAGAAAPPPGAAVPPAGVPPPAAQYNAAPVAQSTPMAENVASALAYVLGLITGILFLVLEPYNKNRTVRFHAFQSIFTNLAFIVGWIVLGILAGILRSITGLWFFYSSIFLLYDLACLVLFIYLILSAYQGKRVVLPIIGPLAQQQA